MQNLLVAFTVLLALIEGSSDLSSDACTERSDQVWDALDDVELMKVTLLQTSLNVGARKAWAERDKASEEDSSADLAGSSLLQTDLEVKAVAGNVAISDLRPSACGYPSMAPLEFQAQIEALRASGAFPAEHPCLASGTRRSSLQLVQFEAISDEILLGLPIHRYYEWCIILGYAMFYSLCMALLIVYVAYPPSQHYKAVEYTAPRCKRVSDVDVEEETWRNSCLAWLAVSWASPWVARWGHSQNAALTKIKADDLPQIGSKELQARQSAELFEKLWKEEIQRVGEANANLGRVIIQIYTVRTMLYLMAVLAIQITLSQVYSVFLIQEALSYYHYLQAYQEEHGEMPDMRAPLLLAIAVFSALPFSNILLSSINNSISCQLDQRLCGGLSIALFRKAQRMPCSKLVVEKEGHDEEVLKATNGAVSMPQADLMTLINYDVNTNLQGCYQQLCMFVNSAVSVFILMVLLWCRLRLATLCAAAVAVPVVFFSLAMSAGLGHSMFKLQECMDKRITTLREVLFGIRVVKCYAWEEAMEDKIALLRREEVRCLSVYYHYLGAFVGTFLSFPRLLILSGIWGYSAIYGHHDVATIFTCMQILSSLKGNCDLFTRSLGRAIVIQPSIQRLEHFLKQPEAPVLPPEKVPDWVQLWPDREEEANSQEPIYTRGGKPSVLRIKGSFKWAQESYPVLQDLNLEVPSGELVAVVGAVGSGKSTLVQAILGELYPDLSKETSISRPGVIAYCSQVPHIAEGTLRDNVLFGQAYDEERYSDSLRAASLEGDLKMLPGGDGVPIGSRGITLSGGQKSRISMARAAYHKGSELVISDDPFGAVDAPTAMVLLEKLLLGPLLREKTRLVILQPDAERITKFDRVVVMSAGRIVAQGPPHEVMQTEEYKRLLQSTSTEGFSAGVSLPVSLSEEDRGSPVRRKEESQAQPSHLRDEEFEGRPTWEMIKHYCRMGRWRNIINTCVIFFMQIFIYLLCDLVLARWTNAMAADPTVEDKPYLLAYLFWLILGTAFWVVCWKFGEWFTLRISAHVHGDVLRRILRAPVDKFFDKHPVGRIMNRLAQDLAVVDLFLFMRSTGTIAIVYQTLIPLTYIHCIMPVIVSIMALPLYYLIWTCCVRYWNTTVPLRYCMSSARSDVNSLVSDVINNNVVIRAYKDQERISLEMGDAIDNQLKAGLLGDRVLRRWLVNRIIFMWSFYTTATYMVAIMNTATIGAGTLGLCMTNLLLLESLIEPNLESATGAQFEFIALARIHEYMSVPQEKDMRTKGDTRYRSFSARISRKALGKLICSVSKSGAVEVKRDGKVLLQSSADGTCLMPASECISGKGVAAQLKDLCPSNKELLEAESWHRIVSVNDAVRDAGALATELCSQKVTALSFSGKDQVIIGVQSGWLLDGARVKVENIKAGYADQPRDVLKGINLTFEPRTKVGIVGTTGCGKSSLLLVLLRVLEPRAGRVLINGVDTRDLGLATVRSSMGLVPQDPVLFSGTVRHNLDPFQQYTDGRILRALKIAGILEMVEEFPQKLYHQITDEGNNLSFGQRQLMCIARMVLRQPAVLLLDEATSAIDPHTQEKVQETINSAFPDSTLVAVAHRLETILDFDEVIVMDKGNVAEQGPVKEVAKRKDGLFRQMLATKKAW
mmetsp:Transcript_8378/g.14889  ORF Transcript_8378/g.14889 Transcript_8378/m.14889 type:complete len:1637 (+) Transcript_8378:146-5056(+)|eukprot:CAMPEP_0197661904 /NCGR_PEP_ID=MMETSP1338-20131121/51738_1 /TAXON_ID=43686 ORGANISM="Pelagodinium beii, Strain RCC1491" /NCGR_SAMPLE_ID=MMETSP1338 /ASSEMBLY_ACC=CAM_ASM_000754 /LENGTH=1636 /DNA_ID=CAMNT_0043239553 /DNA_START=74 /DNA_END=4981 /DNA_ORIENTATION=+